MDRFEVMPLMTMDETKWPAQFPAVLVERMAKSGYAVPLLPYRRIDAGADRDRLALVLWDAPASVPGLAAEAGAAGESSSFPKIAIDLCQT